MLKWHELNLESGMQAAWGGGRSPGTTPVQGWITRPSRSLASRELRFGSHASEHSGCPALIVRLLPDTQRIKFRRWRVIERRCTHESIGRPLSVSQTTTWPATSPVAR